MRDTADRGRRGRLGAGPSAWAPAGASWSRSWAGAAALSVTAYVPDAVLAAAAAAAGAAASGLATGAVLVCVVLLLLVAVSYRQTAREGQGVGDLGYGVVASSLGTWPGLVTAAALLTCHALALAVCTATAASYLAVTVPRLAPATVQVAAVGAAALGLAVLGADRQVGRGLSRLARVCVPAYAVVLGAVVVAGLAQDLTGSLGRADSAVLEVLPETGGQHGQQGLPSLAALLPVMGVLVSGSAVLTGVGPVFGGGCLRGDRPGSGPDGSRRGGRDTAQDTRRDTVSGLVLLATGAALVVVIVYLAGTVGARVVEDPAGQLLRDDLPVGEGYHQLPASVQVARAVFADAPLVPFLVVVTTVAVMLLVGATVLTRLPVLAAVLGRDHLLPHRMCQPGDRRVRLWCAAMAWLGAVVLLVVARGSVARLLPPYVLTTSVYLTLVQVGMMRHWSYGLARATDPRARQRMRRSRALNAAGAAATGTVLVGLLSTWPTRDAWIVLAVLALLAAVCLIMRVTWLYYRRVSAETSLNGLQDVEVLPAQVRAVVLASRFHQLTVRALTYARSTHPASVEVLTVDMGDGSAERLVETWEEAGVAVPLTVLGSPTLEVVPPVVSYIRSLRSDAPQDLVVVFLPEHLVSHWWERVLLSSTTTRLGAAMRRVPGVVVASVPWRLATPGQPGRGGPGGQGAAGGVEDVMDADVAARRASRRRRGQGGPG
ncbi:DNA-binding protein [Actinomyces sp. 2119]|uniref:DNA-binding protein n=1 Tax=Actinomyces sp. 2119 TaxID=2321393 RepID=UPI0016025276|nr:DNA-binding protein [Actinomyces sp. 2119]